MIDARHLTKLLRIFVATIESLDQQQFDLLIAGKARLTLTPHRRSKEAGVTPPIDHTSILERLNDTKDRVEARRILGEIGTRDELERFARALKVHVVKHDRRDDIEAKVIEFVIGGRLRTEAIKSLNLRGGSSN